MRELFNYLRRSWRLLLLGIALGAAVGFIWHIRFVADTEFQATVTANIGGIELQLVSGILPSEEAAILSTSKDVRFLNRMARYSNAFNDITRQGFLTSQQRDLEPVQSVLPTFLTLPPRLNSAKITDVSVEGWVGHPAWTQVALGGTIGLLIIIGGIQVWEGLPRDRDRRDDLAQ